MRASVPTSTAPELSPQEPWPGLAPYNEQSQEYFCGREEESGTLLRLVRQSPLTVIYGKSGLRKTSLLQAGLFPLLRKERILSHGESYLPIYIRLTLQGSETEPVLNQVKSILRAELEEAKAEYPPMIEEETLWEYLHRQDLEFWGSDNFLVTPVFVFDQFEELFSKGAGSPRRTSETFRDLADLAANTIPSSLNEPSARDRCAMLDLLSHRYRVVLSFREDFLPQMKDWEHQVPSLLRNYLHLQPMSGATAIQAVERAGVEVLEPGVVQRIVDFVGRQDSDSQRCETESLVIEPVLLSLCCSELNRRRTSGSKIDCALVETAGEDILETFYRTALNDPQVKGGPNVATFIEERLIQGDRFRSDYPVDEALKCTLLSEGQLKVLTDVHRLLRIVPHADTVRVELIHDRLVPIVSKAREERRNIEKRKQRARRVRLTVLIAAGLAVGLGWIELANTRVNISESRALAFDAWREIANDPARGAQLALAAMKIDPDNLEAVDVLRQSLLPLEIVHSEKLISVGMPISEIQYSKDGSALVVAYGEKVAIYDSRTYESRYVFKRKERVSRAWLIGKNNTLITHSTDGHAQIQNIEESTVHVLSCPGEQNLVYTVTVSPDDRYVAIGCFNGEVLVWHAAYGASGPAYTYSPKIYGGVTITALAFFKNGQYLASGDAVGSVNVWKLGHPTAWIGADEKTKMDSPIKHELYSSIRDIAFHPNDSELIVTAGDDKRAIVWQLDLEHRRVDRDNQKIPKKWILNHKHEVIASRFTPPRNGLSLVVTVSGKAVHLWSDILMNNKQGRGHDDLVTDANSSDDAEWVVTASADNTARIWSTRLGNVIAVLRGHSDTVSRAVFSPDAKHIVTGAADGMIRVWKFQPPKLVAQLERWVLGAAFDTSGERVVVGEENGAFIVNLNRKNAMPVSQRLIEGYPVSDLTWSQNGKYILGLVSNKNLFASVKPILWEIGDEPKIITPQWFDHLRIAAFTPQGEEILTVSHYGEVAIWDIEDLLALAPVPKSLSREGVGGGKAAMSPDKKWVAVLNGKEARIFRRDDLSNPVRQFVGHEGDIRSLQFSNDSKWLLTASADKTARVWSVEETGKTRVLEGGHTAGIHSASYSGNGNLIVTGSADNTIRVWNAGAARLIASLRRHSEGVNSVQFSPDGSQILSASDDGTVQIGQCEACTMAVSDLKRHAEKLAQLPEKELAQIRKRAGLSASFLPDFISRHIEVQ